MKPLAESRFGNLRMTSENRFPIAMSQQRRTYIFRRLVDVALAAALVFSIASVRAADKGKWIETWAASPQPVWNADFLAPIRIAAFDTAKQSVDDAKSRQEPSIG